MAQYQKQIDRQIDRKEKDIQKYRYTDKQDRYIDIQTDGWAQIDRQIERQIDR